MKYQPITDKQQEQIKILFNYHDQNGDSFDFETTETGYFISVYSEYGGYLSFNNLSTLQGYLKIAEILGVTDGNEIGRNAIEGCPTCGFGGTHSIDLHFW
jgi:hypothetical protein